MSKVIKESIPELQIEFTKDDTGQTYIWLEQDSFGNVDCVSVHPAQLKYMAEKMGFANKIDAEKIIERLGRELLCLRERIVHLSNSMDSFSNEDYSKFSSQIVYAKATADVANIFCLNLSQGDVTSSVNSESVGDLCRNHM